MAKAGPFDARAKVRTPRIPQPDVKQIQKLVKKLTDEPVGPLEDLVMQLTARTPWESAKRQMDVLWPGRYDTESNLVFMRPIVTGPSAGEWDGTVVYARFSPSAGGSHLIAANFSGHEITGHLAGPWGDQTAFSATTSDTASAVAIWNGGDVSFTFTCTGDIIGYLKSIEVYKIS